MNDQTTGARIKTARRTLLAVAAAVMLIPSTAHANVKIKDGNYVGEINPSKIYPTAALLTKDGKIVQAAIFLPFRNRKGKLCTPFPSTSSPPHPKHVGFATVDKIKKKPDGAGRFVIALKNMNGWDGSRLTVKGQFTSSTSVSFSVFVTRNGCSARRRFVNAAFHEKIYTGPGWDQ